ncbi:MAG TPA: ISL3 family transposase, partial [Gemmatimonadales bacterium]|nr:ISL3 family transposase [Gemmatimonadales bacterium]
RPARTVLLHVRRRSHARPRCTVCRTPLGGTLTTHPRRWRHLDILGWRCLLVADVREGRCPRCNGRRVERVPWAAPRAWHTTTFDRQVASLAQVADRSAAARVFHLAWRSVGAIIARVVAALLPADRLDGLEAMGVDETSYKRGHRYLTLVTNLYTGAVVWVGEGKSAETLGQFFADLGPARATQIQVVAMDLSGAFQAAVRAHAPQADLVFDRFHIVQLLGQALDEIRREECRALTGPARDALKGTRFALLRNPKHRTPTDEAAIAAVQATNHRLARAYQLRVDFDDLWACGTEDDARAFLGRWTTAALRSRREPLRRFARTVRAHQPGILGFFRWGGLTNAQLEGLNNKVKLCIHRAYGFRSVAGLRAMVFLICGGIDLAA